LLSTADRARVIRGALALRLLDPTDRSLDAQTFGAFLRSHGQNDATIQAMWSIVATATLNLAPDDASLALAAKVFRTGLLDHAPAADVGYAAVPLGDLHSTAAASALTAAGVEVHTGRAVDSLDGGLVRAGDRTISADAVVLAVPHHDAGPLVTPATGSRFAAMGTSPIVNVHVVYDRKVTDLAFAAAVDSPVQWFFDRTDSSGLRRVHPRGQYLAVTVSAADAVVNAFVTRERNATFRQAAGSWALRPAPTAGPDGVWLAGAWTDTGWPDTMESAVRSGIAAAEAALDIPQHEVTEFAA
jgi:hypothetical protein